MRPMDSAYDRMIDDELTSARARVDADELEAGDVIDYEDAEEIGIVGWRDIIDQLRARGLELVDDGSGYEVRCLDTSDD